MTGGAGVVDDMPCAAASGTAAGRHDLSKKCLLLGIFLPCAVTDGADRRVRAVRGPFAAAGLATVGLLDRNFTFDPEGCLHEIQVHTIAKVGASRRTGPTARRLLTAKAAKAAETSKQSREQIVEVDIVGCRSAVE